MSIKSDDEALYAAQDAWNKVDSPLQLPKLSAACRAYTAALHSTVATEADLSEVDFMARKCLLRWSGGPAGYYICYTHESTTYYRHRKRPCDKVMEWLEGRDPGEEAKKRYYTRVAGDSTSTSNRDAKRPQENPKPCSCETCRRREYED